MGKRLSISVLAKLAIFTITANGNTLKQAQAEKGESQKVKCICPIHSEVISYKLGQYPKWGMDLVKREAKATKVIYTCTMLIQKLFPTDQANVRNVK